MTIPSKKTLAAITSYPRELRQLLEIRTAEGLIKLLDAKSKPFGKRSVFEGFKHCSHQYQFISRSQFHELKMLMADELCETCGVEYIPRGSNSKSPSIEYLNAGDTYTTTLLWTRGSYRVGCWGDIVERGNYA